MQNENKNIESLKNICEETRFALTVSDDLTDEQVKHLCECTECRTFKEQNDELSTHFSVLRADFDGKTLGVADSVMKEINAQKFFTLGTPIKTRHFFRHAGLVAACLIVTVMAIPLMNGAFKGANSADSAAENESIMQDVVYDAQTYNYKMTSFDGGDDSLSVESANGTILTDECADEEALNDVADAELPLRMTANGFKEYSGNIDASLFGAAGTIPESQSENIYGGENQMIPQELLDAVKSVADENSLDVADAFVISVSEKDAVIDFTDPQSHKIFRIHLEYSEGAWNVTSTENFETQLK